MLVSGGLTAIAVAGFMAAMALRTGSSEAVQGVFPLVFIALFFSSAFFPRQTMSGAYRHIANANPISYLIEGMRDLCITGFTASACAKALLVPIGIMVVSFALALRSLARRVAAQ
jgi:ABC-2 type transport system permease protein